MGVGTRNVHDYDRIVDKTKGKQAYTRDIEHELLLHLERYIFLRFRLEVLRIRKFIACDDEQHQRHDPWDCQNGKAGGIHLKGRTVGLEQHHEIQQHGAEERAYLVEHFLYSEALADALLRRRKGHYRILCRLLYRLAHALDDQQRAGRDPAALAHQRERRNREDVQNIAKDGHRPIALRLVRELAENIAHRVPDKLTETRHEADRRRRRAQKRQVRAADAGRALVSHIRKKTHYPEQDYKQHRL